jgi:nitric oxide reductase subunit B-like protein
VAGKVVDPSGKVLFARADVESGQKVFLNNGLMEYGSTFGPNCCRSASSSSMSRSATATSTPARSTSSPTRRTPCWSGCASPVRALHRRRDPAPALHLLDGSEVPGQARDPGGAGGDPLHRRHRAGFFGGGRPSSVETLEGSGYQPAPQSPCGCPSRCRRRRGSKL